MRKVFTASHPAEAHLALGWLSNEGIDARIQGEELFQTRGGVPITPDTLPTVWVLNDEDEARAKSLLSTRSEAADDPKDLEVDAWRCPKCGELIEPEFTTCWNCGTERTDLG